MHCKHGSSKVLNTKKISNHKFYYWISYVLKQIAFIKLNKTLETDLRKFPRICRVRVIWNYQYWRQGHYCCLLFVHCDECCGLKKCRLKINDFSVRYVQLTLLYLNLKNYKLVIYTFKSRFTWREHLLYKNLKYKNN